MSKASAEQRLGNFFWKGSVDRTSGSLVPVNIGFLWKMSLYLWDKLPSKQQKKTHFIFYVFVCRKLTCTLPCFQATCISNQADVFDYTRYQTLIHCICKTIATLNTCHLKPIPNNDYSTAKSRSAHRWANNTFLYKLIDKYQCNIDFAAFVLVNCCMKFCCMLCIVVTQT